MPFDFYLELFGYLGTALVIISMLMTSVVKLRLINICGGAISTVYAFVGEAWPIVVLNCSLITINIFQLVRMSRKKATFDRVITTSDDKSAAYFLALYDKDIKHFFPTYTFSMEQNREIHLAFVDSEIVGIVIGERSGNTMQLQLDYAIPKYRDLSVATYLFAKLKEDGICTLIEPIGAPEHTKYLRRMGFSQDGDHMIKLLNGGTYES